MADDRYGACDNPRCEGVDEAGKDIIEGGYNTKKKKGWKLDVKHIGTL